MRELGGRAAAEFQRQLTDGSTEAGRVGLHPAVPGCSGRGVRNGNGMVVLYIWTDRPEPWKRMGCYQFVPSLLPRWRRRESGETLNDCAFECRILGFTTAINTHADSCFCGYQRDFLPVSATAKVDESNCNLDCSGRPDVKCGDSDSAFGVVSMRGCAPNLRLLQSQAFAFNLSEAVKSDSFYISEFYRRFVADLWGIVQGVLVNFQKSSPFSDTR